MGLFVEVRETSTVGMMFCGAKTLAGYLYFGLCRHIYVDLAANRRGKRRHHPIIVPHRNRIELVVVAPRAADREAEKS